MKPSFALFKKIFSFKKRWATPLRLHREPDFLSFEDVSFLQDHLDVGLRLSGIDCSRQWLNRSIHDFFIKYIENKCAGMGQSLITFPMNAQEHEELALKMAHFLSHARLFEGHQERLNSIVDAWLVLVETEGVSLSAGHLSVIVEILNNSKTKKLILVHD